MYYIEIKYINLYWTKDGNVIKVDCGCEDHQETLSEYLTINTKIRKNENNINLATPENLF